MEPHATHTDAHNYGRPRVVETHETDNDGVALRVLYTTRAAGMVYKEQGAPDMSPAELHKYMVEKIRYQADTDPERQNLRMPWATMVEGVTDCKSSAIMIGGISLANGHDVRIRFIDGDGEGQWSHVYAIVDGDAVDPLLPFGVHPTYHEECTFRLRV